MPWKETCVVDERIRFIMEVERGELSKAALCRRFGISRPTADKWLQRYAEGGLTGLTDWPRAPHRHPNETPPELVGLIVSLRRRHPTWGPKKLRVLLEDRYPQLSWPSRSTIHEILRRAGLTVSRKHRHRTPPHTQPFAACDEANAVWCIDFKGWFRTGDGRRCDPLTLSDAYSRYLLRVQVMEETKSGPVRSVCEAAFREYGVPGAIRSDNGPPFASRGLGGLSRLSVWWLKLGIEPERIDPGRPDQNGRHERMHLTLKQETASPPQRDGRRQQVAFDRFRTEFNEVRPHEALGQKRPASVYTASRRQYREPKEVAYPEGFAVRRVKSSGVFNWRGKTVFLGEALSGERVGLVEVADGQWGVYFCQRALGIVDQCRRKVYEASEAVRKGMISESSRRSPFRCAPGTPEGADNM